MMILIRTKLILFFSIIILLMSTLAIVMIQNNNRSIEQYNSLLNRFFLLNDIYMKTTQVNSSIQGYVIDPTPDNGRIEHYRAQAEELAQFQSQIFTMIENESNFLLVKNYYNMIDSYLEQGDKTVRSVILKDQSNYYTNLSQTNKISKFIQDSTLTIINNELSNYHLFYVAIQTKIEYFKQMGIFAVISAILLCLMFSLWFSDGITRPIQLLSNASRQISRGNFNIAELKIKTKDEMQFLIQTFNSMCSNIRFYIQEMKEKSELDHLLRKMEIRSLQNQMNPHFLFNMMNTVTKMAYVEGAEKTSRLLQSISTLLRYHLKKTNHIVPLRDEVNIIREYFYIQSMRFGDRVQFIEDIDEQLLESTVPSLTIQPLIENAFVHGIESMESDAVLTLKIKRHNEQIVIEINDNGIGMSETQLNYILDENWIDEEEVKVDTMPPIDDEIVAHKQESNGIGLRNVIRRLQLYYQEQHVVKIHSKPNKGTTIKLIIPYSETQRSDQFEIVNRR